MYTKIDNNFKNELEPVQLLLERTLGISSETFSLFIFLFEKGRSVRQ